MMKKLVGMVYQDQLFEYLYLHGVRKARAEQITESSDEYPDL